jgi:hypothetical protein
MFRRIFREFTGQEVQVMNGEQFERPATYEMELKRLYLGI